MNSKQRQTRQKNDQASQAAVFSRGAADYDSTLALGAGDGGVRRSAKNRSTKKDCYTNAAVFG